MLKDLRGGWIKIELLHNSFIVKHLTIFKYGLAFPKAWEICDSNKDNNLDLIYRCGNDSGLSIKGYGEVTFDFQNENSFKHIQLIQLQGDYCYNEAMIITGIEFYGYFN
jgi:hypothetical protein